MPREGDTMGRTMGGLIDEARVRWGNREALAFKGRRFSFRELAAEVDRFAKGLIQLGVAPGEKVAAYGITEVGANVSVSFPDATDEQACETSGYPCEGFAVRVVDPETGQEQPRGVAGELLVQSRYMMQEYYPKPEETARALDADGWFHTGDMGILRADGYVRFLGRYKDMLKIGGENVDPVEVEGYLLQHPDIQQAAVVSYPDPKLTEVGVAFVQRRPGALVTEAEVVASCRGRIASFKVPRHVIFVDELPVTSSGKIQKVALRERAVQLLGRDGARSNAAARGGM
jgi:fatty-acyl-CoA synthase